MVNHERSPERDWGCVFLDRTRQRVRWTESQCEQLPINHFDRSVAIANLGKRTAQAARRRYQPNRGQSKHSQDRQDRLHILPVPQQDRSNGYHRSNSESINDEAWKRRKKAQRSQGIGKLLDMVAVLIDEERAAAGYYSFLHAPDRL